ncbi:MAG: hypothetical protein BBJ57_07275 [Desulfobacterales bacterium PC51MH44]|nr:MAG: hypothetical protein BBJ57_07275 [Desulfobacterales bacterium PC51MH44]
MKPKLPPNLEKLRIDHPMYGTPEPGSIQGCFRIPFESYMLTVMSGCGEGWDHVSVSLKNRCPNWKEMCFIKNLFFEPNETVIQFHPPEEVYINIGRTVLHMWKPWDQEIKLPPLYLV